MTIASPLLSVRHLSVRYPLRRAWPWQRAGVLRAIDDLSFELRAGETLGVVGESGSGKSTLARTLVGLQKIDAGSARFDGEELATLDAAGWRKLRGDIQMVFQDPLASLDPRMNVADAVAEPLRVLWPELGAIEREARVREMLEQVGIALADARRKPHEFSGGQCQRIALARALIVRPRLLICDEPVSALDVSVQAQIVNLLRDLQRRLQLAMLFISHDLAVVRHISDRVLVMYFGKAMEQAPRASLFAQARHPYTRALLAAIPGRLRMRQHAARAGALPDLSMPPSGCLFSSRCPDAGSRCASDIPAERRFADGSSAACHWLDTAAS